MPTYTHGGDIYDGGPVRLDFSANINPLGTPAPVLRAAREALAACACYPDIYCRALRGALGAAYGIAPARILCGNGASELILALWACLRPRQTLLPVPAFSEYARAARLFGGTVWAHRLRDEDDFAVTARLLETITPEVNIVALCNPNNPTGRLCDPVLLREILLACRHAGATVLLDECFIEFTHGQSLLPLLGEFPNLLVLRALTKSHAMAGLRLGMLFGADEALLERVAGHLPPWNVSGPAQAAGIAAVARHGWMEATRRVVDEERVYVSGALAALGLTVYPSDANFLLLRGEATLAARLREHGIVVRSCADYDGLDARYIRIGLRKRAENEMLISAIDSVQLGRESG